MKKIFAVLMLVGCASRPAPEPKQDVCVSIYDPHLCIITIDSITFAGHGSNKCVALRKLKQTLIERGHNPLLIQQAECGRVFN